MPKELKKIEVQGLEISVVALGGGTYISLTDMARYRTKDRTGIVLQNWIRNKNTLEFIGIWEKIHNPNFKVVEFDDVKKL